MWLVRTGIQLAASIHPIAQGNVKGQERGILRSLLVAQNDFRCFVSVNERCNRNFTHARPAQKPK